MWESITREYNICHLKDQNDFQKKVYNVFSKENTFDIKIFKFPNNQGGYVIQIHHLFSDSWTLGLVAHKVAEYYNLLLNEQHELTM